MKPGIIKNIAGFFFPLACEKKGNIYIITKATLVMLGSAELICVSLFYLKRINCCYYYYKFPSCLQVSISFKSTAKILSSAVHTNGNE